MTFEIDFPWPNESHDLLALGSNSDTFSDLKWQRYNGPIGRLMGFRRAADLMAKQLLERHDVADLDTLIFPFATCWRHYLELQLKTLIIGFRTLVHEEQKSLHGHSLSKLADIYFDLVKEADLQHSNEAIEADSHARRLIMQLDQIDPTSQEFRYHEDRQGNPTLATVDYIDIAGFHEAMSAVANYCDGADAQVGEYIQIDAEMLAEYEDAMRDYVDY